MIDPYVLLGMMALLPLLEAVNSLIEFAQRRDIFICDFVAALETCHNQLFTYYMNQDTRIYRKSTCALFLGTQRLQLCMTASLLQGHHLQDWWMTSRLMYQVLDC
jgi:hypothetical protein